ncbi:MAG: amino acid adenylation domain-containing protein, partial [Candidatus Binatia bacterium]
KHLSKLPPEQQAIRAKCFHPSGTFVEFPKEEIEQSVPERFEQMVRLYPNRIAVKTRSHELTYEELNQMANCVARAILAQRGKGNEPIALLLEHDVAMITAILAALKAGKIYVPLDPSYPLAWITSMLEDAQPGLILTNTKHRAFAQALAQQVCHVLNIDELDVHFDSENPDLSLSSDTPAYILYTSGSTGQPKGVYHNHRNVLHRVKSDTNVFHFCTDDHVSLLSSCTSNASVGDIFGALLNGATLCPFNFKEEGLVNLINWLIREEITIYHSVPTLFRHVCGTLTGVEQFPTLRLVCLGGEPVYKREVGLYKKHFSRYCNFLNVLGITETHNITAYVIDKDTQIEGSVMPAGYTLEDKEVFLLDDHGEAVAQGHIGEIAIRSRYLSPGYWRRLDLTQAKFLPDPEGGDRCVYLTGDLGRMLPDGCLMHLGRKDFQVKMRGYRIEISEVEVRLLDHAAIKEAAVAACKDQSGDIRLVGYFVPAQYPAPTVSDLRCFLQERLPDYMIPSAFVALEAMPLTPSGKVDRKALPLLNGRRPELDTPYAAPTTPVEEELAKIWGQILSLDQVGIHDNFFELGGHSLAAARLISRVINTFKVELPINSLFDSPTVADMAVVITRNMRKKAGDEELARMLTEVESLSDEEAKRLLARETEPN